MITSDIPQGQGFQRVATIFQPKRVTHTAVSWLHNDTKKDSSSREFNQRNFKISELYK